jgi:hypothetical protein
LKQGAKQNIWAWKEKVTRIRRKLHNKEIHNLDSSPNVIRMINLCHPMYFSVEL